MGHIQPAWGHVLVSSEKTDLLGDTLFLDFLRAPPELPVTAASVDGKSLI